MYLNSSSNLSLEVLCSENRDCFMSLKNVLTNDSSNATLGQSGGEGWAWGWTFTY